MFGRGFEHQGKRQPIKASTINAGIRAASGLLKMRVGPGLLLRWLGDIPVVELADGGAFGARIARNGATAIPGRSGTTTTTLGSGTVTLYTASGAGQLAAGKAVKAWNLASATVAANAWLLLLKVGGLYLVIWEECPA